MDPFFNFLEFVASTTSIKVIELGTIQITIMAIESPRILLVDSYDSFSLKLAFHCIIEICS